MQKSAFFTLLLIVAAVLVTSVFWEWRSRQDRPVPQEPPRIEQPEIPEAPPRPNEKPAPPPVDVLGPLTEAAARPSSLVDMTRFRAEQERLSRRQQDQAKQNTSEGLRLVARAEQAQARFREASNLSDRIQVLALENSLIDQRLTALRETFAGRLSQLATAVTVLACRDKEDKRSEEDILAFASASLACGLLPRLVLDSPEAMQEAVVSEIVAGMGPGRIEPAPAPPLAAALSGGQLCLLQSFYVYPKITARSSLGSREPGEAPSAPDPTGFSAILVSGDEPKELPAAFSDPELSVRARSLFSSAAEQNALSLYRVKDLQDEYAAAAGPIKARKAQVLEQMAGLRAALETSFPEGLARIEKERAAAEEELNSFAAQRRGLYVENVWGVCSDPDQARAVIASLAEKAVANAVARAKKDLPAAVFVAENHHLAALDGPSFYTDTFAEGYEPPAVYWDATARVGESGFCGLLAGIWVATVSSRAEASAFTQGAMAFHPADHSPPSGKMDGLGASYTKGDTAFYTISASDDTELSRMIFSIDGTNICEVWEVSGTEAERPSAFATGYLSPGRYSWTLTVKDAAGNDYNATGSFSIAD